MKKAAVLSILSVLFVTNITYASANQMSLDEKIQSLSSTKLNENNQIVLDEKPYGLKNVHVAPNYSYGGDKVMFATSPYGAYQNYNYNAAFFQRITWPGDILNNEVAIAYDGFFDSSDNIIAYNDSIIYLSYDKGRNWGEVYTSEIPFLKVDFGPDFSTSEWIYFINENGLERINVDTKNVYNVVSNDEEGSVADFNYLRTTNKEYVFYVAKGNKIMETQNSGNSWDEYEFDDPIRFFAVVPDGGGAGDIIVFTQNNRAFYSYTDLNFAEITMPSEINQIYGAKYIPEYDTDKFIMFTDKGFYLTNDDGDNWQHLDYQIDFSKSPVTDFYGVVISGDVILYAVIGGKLYRDANVPGEFEEYMDGIDPPGYVESGNAVSKDIIALDAVELDINDAVGSVTLNVDQTLNGQTATYSVTADGVNWHEVAPGEEFEFEVPGKQLKWKAELQTTDSSVTPRITDVDADYTIVEVSECAGFSDVQVDDPICDALNYVRKEGIFTGYPDGTFKPDQAINRAEAVKVITEGFDYEILEDPGTDLGFIDVIIGEWYMQYLYTAKEAGIIEGYPDGTYRPEDTVNYVEMMKIFLETANAELEEPPADAAWYREYVDYASMNNLVVYEDLDSGMTRGDVAQLFYDWHVLDMQAL
jgi:hypothetical protein